MNEIMSFALESGIWATLFCFLFFYMLKDSRSREDKYTETIRSLCAELGDLSAVAETCSDIKLDCKEGLRMDSAIKDDCECIKESVDKMAKRERE